MPDTAARWPGRVRGGWGGQGHGRGWPSLHAGGLEAGGGAGGQATAQPSGRTTAWRAPETRSPVREEPGPGHRLRGPSPAPVDSPRAWPGTEPGSPDSRPQQQEAESTFPRAAPGPGGACRQHSHKAIVRHPLRGPQTTPAGPAVREGARQLHGLCEPHTRLSPQRQIRSSRSAHRGLGGVTAPRIRVCTCVPVHIAVHAPRDTHRMVSCVYKTR